MELSSKRFSRLGERQSQLTERADEAMQRLADRKRLAETTEDKITAMNDEWDAERKEERERQREFQTALLTELHRHNELLEALLNKDR